MYCTTYLSARRDSGEEHEDGGDGGGDVEERQQESTVVLLRGVPAHCPADDKLALLSQLTFSVRGAHHVRPDALQHRF